VEKGQVRIYTRSGDAGETGLFGGKRVAKHSRRIVAYGEVDETNALLGWCAVAAPPPLAERLQREMEQLFTLGSHLATPARAAKATRERLPAWDDRAVPRLEVEIDELTEELGEVRHFVLPGGCELAARLHVARSACRRAERAVTDLATKEKVDPVHLAYLNRLSDWLFVLARAANHSAKVQDILWIPEDEEEVEAADPAGRRKARAKKAAGGRKEPARKKKPAARKKTTSRKSGAG